MAAVAHLVATTSSSNTTSYASGAFTPTAGDLLVVFVTSSGTVGFPTLDDSQGLGFTLIQRTTQAAGNTMYLFVANTLAAASSMTVTFLCPDDAATGAVIFVAGVSGMTRLGIDAVVQTAVAASQGAGGTPAATFGASATTSNPTLVFCANAAASALLNPPTNWTELADTGYATPAQWGEYAHRNSGFTGTTITWANTSATAFGVLIVELDASTATRTPPWVEAVGAVAIAASGNVTPALPAGPVAGDLLVLVVSGADNVTVSNANYTSKLATNQGTALRQTILYRWWQSGDAAPVVTHTAGNAIIGRILLVRGAVGSGDPFEVCTANGTASSATATSANVTPTSAATCVLFIGSEELTANTSGAPVWGAYSGTFPTFGEVADNANGTGSNEVTQAVAWGGAKATTALGARTATISGEAATPTANIATLAVITGLAVAGGAAEALAGTVDGTATVTGALSATVELGGTVAGSATATGALRATVVLGGTTVGTSTVTGALRATVVLAGTAAGTSTVTGALTVAAGLAGTAAGTSTVTGALSATGVLGGTAAGTSTVAGVLSSPVVLAGTVAGSATATGALTVAAGLAGTVAGSSTVTGAISSPVVLAGTAAGSATATGALSATVPLAGSVAGSSTATGDLSVASAAGSAEALEGTVAGSSSAAGALSAVVPIAASVAGSSTLAAALSAMVPLVVSAEGSSTVAGALSATVLLAGTTAGSSTVIGDLTIPTPTQYGAQALVGVAAGSSTVTGALSSLVDLGGETGGDGGSGGAARHQRLSIGL